MGTDSERFVDIREPMFSVPLKKLPESMAVLFILPIFSGG
jgi:hypothetical protein